MHLPKYIIGCCGSFNLKNGKFYVFTKAKVVRNSKNNWNYLMVVAVEEKRILVSPNNILFAEVLVEDVKIV